MVSNTKLTLTQKQYVKRYEKVNTIYFFNNGKITLMVKPEFNNSRMLAVSISTMAPDENKFRKSVGKYFAINNFENGQYVLMSRETLFDFMDNALCINTEEAYDLYCNMYNV